MFIDEKIRIFDVRYTPNGCFLSGSIYNGTPEHKYIKASIFIKNDSPFLGSGVDFLQHNGGGFVRVIGNTKMSIYEAATGPRLDCIIFPELLYFFGAGGEFVDNKGGGVANIEIARPFGGDKFDTVGGDDVPF